MCHTTTPHGTHTRCHHPACPPTTTPCPARYSDPIHCDIMSSSTLIDCSAQPYCPACSAKRDEAKQAFEGYFEKVEREIGEGAGVDFAPARVGWLRRVNWQVREGEVGWLRGDGGREVW